MDLMRVLQDESYVNKIVTEGNEQQRRQSKKAKRMLRLSMAVACVVGAAVGVGVGALKKKSGGMSAVIPGIFNVYVDLLLFFVASFVQMVIHEGGHLVFGLLSGYEFLSFRIGSVMVVKKDGRILWKRYSIQGTGGQCVMRAPARGEDGEFPFLLYNMGGVIMNVVSAVVFGVIGMMMFGSFVGEVCLIFAGVGVLLAAMNGIPMRLSVNNDGMNAKIVKKSKVAREAFYMQLDLNAKCSDGVRIKDMGEAYYELPKDADLTELLVGYQKLLAYDYYAECYDFKKANECIEELEAVEDKMAAFLKNAVGVERLFLLILADAPKELIRFYYDNLKNTALKAKHDLAAKRVLFAYELLVNQDKDAAERVKKDFDKLVLKFPVEGEAMLHQDLLQFVMGHQDEESRKELF